MNPENRFSKTQEPAKTKEYIRSRYALVGLALGAAAISFGLRGCGDYLDNKGQTEAKQPVHEIFENLEASDIVSCDVTGVAAAKQPINYQGIDNAPSLLVSMNVAPTESQDDKWFRKNSSDGDYQAEIMWPSQLGISTEHNLANEDSDNETSHLRGYAILEDRLEANSAGVVDLDSQPGQLHLPFSGISTIEKQAVNIIIPVNSNAHLEGKRTISLNSYLSPVILSESWRGEPIDDSENNPRSLSQICATIEVNVEDNKVSVLSAEDADGDSIAIE